MNWSMISHVSRLRRCAIRAVAQKTHPMGQPTCDDRQRLTAPGLCSGIRTVSTAKTVAASGTEASEIRRSARSLIAPSQSGQRESNRFTQPPGNLKITPPDHGIMDSSSHAGAQSADVWIDPWRPSRVPGRRRLRAPGPRVQHELAPKKQKAVDIGTIFLDYHREAPEQVARPRELPQTDRAGRMRPTVLSS